MWRTCTVLEPDTHSLRASGSREPSRPSSSAATPTVLTGRARATEAAGAARVTRGCASAPGPGRRAVTRREGLPGTHGGRRGQTLRREGSRFTRSEGDWPRETCWHRRRLRWMCRMGEETRAFARASPLDRRTGPRAAAGPRGQEQGGRRTARAAGHCAWDGEERQAPRSRFRGAAGGHGQPLARSPPRLPLDAGPPARRKEPTPPIGDRENRSYPGCRLRPFCVLPPSQRKSERAARLAARHLRTGAPSAVRSRVPRAHPAPRGGRCSPPGALTPTWAQAGSLRSKDPPSPPLPDRESAEFKH